MGSMHSEQLRIRVLSALIKERKRQGLTITEVARRIGTSRSRISEIENSRTETITLTMLADYCKSLDVEPIFAFKRNGMARLTDIAEELGWKVFMDGNESMCDYNMEKFSPKGQDFNCTIILEKKKCDFRGLGTFPHLRSSDKQFSVFYEKEKLFFIRI